jgi:hypothetical protein
MEGEAEPYEEFKEVWVNLEGIHCKYLTWKVIAQVASTIGVLVDVDCLSSSRVCTRK